MQFDNATGRGGKGLSHVGKALRHVTRSRSAIFAPLGDVGRAQRVEQRLADAIRSGLLTDGERLPSEQELAAMLGVAVPKSAAMPQHGQSPQPLPVRPPRSYKPRPGH